MEFKTREDIKHFILEIERTFPVNDWKFDDIHIWPYIRIQLFFYIRSLLVNDIQNKKPFTENNTKSQNYLLRKVKMVFHACSFLIWKLKLKKVDTIFYAHEAHRVNFKDKKFNRFFDTLILDGKITGDYYYFEKNTGLLQNIFNYRKVLVIDKRIYQFSCFNSLKNIIFKKKNTTIELDGYDLFLDYLSSIDITCQFVKRFTQEKLFNWFNYHFDISVKFYLNILTRINPKKMYILCYYSDLAFVTAANKLKIDLTEFQHGAQTDEHLCYGSWSKVPNSGYALIPYTYWSWDEKSKNCIVKWASKNNLYKCFVGGNPWVEYWKRNKQELKFKAFILYTLQPNLALDELFNEHIINFIKNHDLTWFIRMHPMQLSIKAFLESIFIKHEIINKINLQDATFEPLPLLIKECKLHITNSSASTIEAAMFNKKTILLHETGYIYYKEQIKEGKARYIPLDNNFEQIFREEIEKLK